MKIALCNKYFFLNGGTERYLFDLLRQLSDSGHTAVPFSVNYAGSRPSPYSKYFLPAPGHPEQARFDNIRPSTAGMLRHLDRSIYSLEARRRLSRLVNATHGFDVAYLLNIYNYMSPSIVHALRRHRIPVVFQVGDYNLMCPAYQFLRNGRPCTLCLHGTYLHGLRHRCIKRSCPISAVRVCAMYLHKWLGIYREVDAFVVPCHFMQEKLVQAGFPPDRIHMLRYPVDSSHQHSRRDKSNYVLYFGRISYEKGLDTLIRAYQKMTPQVNLVLVGRSHNGERERLERLISPDHAPHIRFLGFQEGAELSRWIGEALFSVVPSRWYDNAPISIYESMLHETPVLAADIGGIPEQIQDGITGKLFAADSETELMNGWRWMLRDRIRLEQMGRAGRDFVTKHCSMERHLYDLLQLFENVIGSRGR